MRSVDQQIRHVGDGSGHKGVLEIFPIALRMRIGVLFEDGRLQ